MLKKLVIIFIALLAIINISGCGDKGAKHQAKTALTLMNVCEEETNKTALEQRQKQFTEFYEAENNITANSKSSYTECPTYEHTQNNGNNPRLEQYESKAQKAIKNNNDAQAADTYKNLDGYPNIYGIMSANNGIMINGNVSVYGGLYTQDEIKMANGSYAIINNSYIDKIATYPKKYNGDVFLKDKMDKNLSDIIPVKPVNMQNVKRKIKLVNISEEELTEIKK